MIDKSKEIVIKNCTYNFSDDMINIKIFYLNKIIQKWKVIQNNLIYYTEYMLVKDYAIIINEKLCNNY